jgi:hypothetical protein
VLVATSDHRLVYGTGETFGTRGQRFESRIAQRLLARQGRGAIGMLYVDSTSTDQMRAVLAADALLGSGLVVRDPGRAGPPEIVTCASRSWRWDGVSLELAPTPSGKSCAVIVNTKGSRIVLSSEAIDAVPADLLLLPRNADKAQLASINRGLRAGGFAIASIDRRQWEGGRWRDLRNLLAGTGIKLRATAVDGAMHFETGAGGSGIRMQSGTRHRPGIWSRQTRANSCPVGL